MKFTLFILTVALLGSSKSYNILLLSPLGSKSHVNAYMGMFKPLTENGHQLTILSHYGSFKSSKNIRHIGIPEHIMGMTPADNVFDEGKNAPLLKLILGSPEMCTDTLSTDVVQDLKNENFDLILLSAFFSDCYFSLIHHFKVPYVYVTSTGITGAFSEIAGNPYFISLSGHLLIESKFPLSYLQRLKSTIVDTSFNSFMKYITYRKMESMCRMKGLCPADMPSFQKIRANASLVISNSVKLLQPNPVPDMPHIIYAGGSQCRPSQPLPEELDKWIQESGNDGFIFFSLGSAVTPSDMTERQRKIFRNVFGKLKQRVLWKWDKDMDDLPPNVRLGKWLPQQDIIAHPKQVLFISHGGLLSTLEATYHGSRILGMPIYGDQHKNIQDGVNEGWAESLQWEDLTEESLENKILSVINNKEMDEIVAKRARIMIDLPMPANQEVAYWIEYIIRHNGASHLKSPIHHMPIYVLYNVDVWFTIVAIFFGILAACYSIMKTIFQCCCTQKPKLTKKKKKN